MPDFVSCVSCSTLLYNGIKKTYCKLVFFSSHWNHVHNALGAYKMCCFVNELQGKKFMQSRRKCSSELMCKLCVGSMYKCRANTGILHSGSVCHLYYFFICIVFVHISNRKLARKVRAPLAIGSVTSTLNELSAYS